MTENHSKTPQAQYLTASAADEAQRLDNFLLKTLKGAPRSLIYRIIRSGEVRINKGRAQASYRLQLNDLIRIPPLRLSTKTAPIIANSQLEQLKNAIIYEENGLLVINKPASIAVHGGSGISYGVIEGLRKLRPDLPELELVHRLDRETSGLLMLASKRSMLRYLQQQLQNGQIKKTYTALVQGIWRHDQIKIDAPILKNVLASGERISRINQAGKTAQTKFKLLQSFGENASLISAQPITGRTHQIRVHCQYAGHPIAGDSKYGNDAFNQIIAKLGSKRLFLHANSLQFKLPNGTKLELKAPLAPIWQELMAKI